MTFVERNIKLAQDIINNNVEELPAHNFYKIYSFSNENLIGILNQFDLQDKKCLTVLGSSDQTLDMCLKGATSITSFDINPLTEYYYYLKKAFFKSNLSFQEYIDFFCYKINVNNDKVFDKNVFEKISQYLEGDSYSFWSTLFDEYTSSEIKQYSKCSLFYVEDETRPNIIRCNINYFNEKNYAILREKIKDLQFDFIHSDINHLDSKLKEQYDFMYFSNIIQYVHEMYLDPNDFYTNEYEYYKLQATYLNKYKEKLIELSSHLKDKGCLMGGYIYWIDENYNKIAILNHKIRENIFGNSGFNLIHFPSFDSSLEDNSNVTDSRDGALVLIKEK